MVGDKSPGKDMYVVPVPVPDDMIAQYDTAPTLQDMVMYSVNARSKHLNEAWELLKHLRNEEADMFWITQDLGATATTKSALSSSEAQRVKDIPLYINELNHARPWPPHPKMIAIAGDIYTPYCQKAIVGELTPKAALDQAAREAQELINPKK
jgi:ABC-type glycerol-3-phosphate transport system substrate-binding protein